MNEICQEENIKSLPIQIYDNYIKKLVHLNDVISKKIENQNKLLLEQESIIEQQTNYIKQQELIIKELIKSSNNYITKKFKNI